MRVMIICRVFSDPVTFVLAFQIFLFLTLVVYSISLACVRVYMRETRRTLKQKISEHKRAVKDQDKNNDIAVHALQTGHNIKWEDVMMTHREQLWTRGRPKRNSASRLKTNNMNLDTTAMNDPNWNLNC